LSPDGRKIAALRVFDARDRASSGKYASSFHKITDNNHIAIDFRDISRRSDFILIAYVI
jgi:hypothetical protein